jgi:hypothetical protein
MKTTFAAALARLTAITIAAPTSNTALLPRETLFGGPARIRTSEEKGNSQMISIPTDGRDHQVTNLTGGHSSILFVENDGFTEATNTSLVDLNPLFFAFLQAQMALSQSISIF